MDGEKLGMQQVLAALRASLEPCGFDVLHPFRIGAFNERVDPALALDDLGSADHLAIVVGNTRALWPVWLAALADDPALASRPDPLDAYTERSLLAALGQLAVPKSVHFAHVTGARTLAIQRIAHAAGLAYLTDTHMSVHETYGPWLALRAVVCVSVAGPPGSPAPMAHPCGDCASGCRPAFERALATLAGAPSAENARAHWRAWLACRDACPVGREHRYTEAQIRYHYCRRLVLPTSDGSRAMAPRGKGK